MRCYECLSIFTKLDIENEYCGICGNTIKHKCYKTNRQCDECSSVITQDDIDFGNCCKCGNYIGKDYFEDEE
jgi:hypothetical protein